MQRWHEYRVDLAYNLVQMSNVLLLGEGDSACDAFDIELLNNGEPKTVTELDAVKAYFIRPDGVTVTLEGDADSNHISVTLSADCYIYTGHYTLAVKCGGLTICRVEGTIVSTSSDVMLDNGDTYSLAQLMELINAKVDNPAGGKGGDALFKGADGKPYWAEPNALNVAGKVKVDSTDYTLRTGTSGASGFLTFVLE